MTMQSFEIELDVPEGSTIKGLTIGNTDLYGLCCCLRELDVNHIHQAEVIIVPDADDDIPF